MVKDRIAGTQIGLRLLKLRAWYDLRSLSFNNPERAAMVANLHIADKLIVNLPDEGSRFLDIGAHLGSVFSAVHCVDPSISVTAIEADGAKAKSLAARFPYCKVLNYAVGETNGTATFHQRERSGYNSLAGGDGEDVIGEIQVELRRLDSLFRQEKFDTIKLDIEGAELGALRGGRNLLRRSRPTLMFESVDVETNSLGYSAEKLYNWFTSEGYQVVLPNRVAHDSPPLTREAFLDAHVYPRQSHNFFAIAAEKRIQIRDKARDILGVMVPA